MGVISSLVADHGGWTSLLYNSQSGCAQQHLTVLELKAKKAMLLTTTTTNDNR